MCENTHAELAIQIWTWKKHIQSVNALNTGKIHNDCAVINIKKEFIVLVLVSFSSNNITFIPHNATAKGL